MSYHTALGRFNRPTYQPSTHIPECPLPPDLEAALDVKSDIPLSRQSKMYANILKILDPFKYVDLSESHYVQLLKFALYLEEYHNNEEMKKHKMINQIVKELPMENLDEILYSIQVKELDEERAWIREEDFVDLTDPRTDQTYTLRVAKIKQSDIVVNDENARFSEIFEAKNLYDINFRHFNYSMKCDHYALSLAHKENVITYLFPHKAKPFIQMESASYKPLMILNPNIEANPEQKQAVLNIVNKSSFPAPYILYGPPGTGKTATLIEAICQIKKASSSNRILVCTPSNTAADEVARRLLKFLDANDIYRIYSQSKDKSSVDKELRDCCFWEGGVENRFPLQSEDIFGKAVLISTFCIATKFVLMKVNGTLNADYFSHIIIDEAGQGTEPNTLIPISIASSDGKLYSQIVLAGDPQQLEPTVKSNLAETILGRSILERLMSYDIYRKDSYDNYNPKYITKLLHNYRSHPSIIHISNQLFYDNELVAKFPRDDQHVEFPVIFHGVEGTEEKFSYSPSTCNFEVICTVFKYVYDLIDNKTEFGNISAKDIGIITPFKLQSKLIRKQLEKKDKAERKKLIELGNWGDLLGDKISDDDSDNEKNVLKKEDDKAKLQDENEKELMLENDDDEVGQGKHRRFKDIKVGTIELFQGHERKIIIMTAVKSKNFYNEDKEGIGHFLSNPKRFNVVMTRAQNALIVIGNPSILQKDGMWQYLLKYCIENGSYRGLEFALQNLENGKTIQSEEEVVSTAMLFQETPFKLFPLNSLDSTVDISRTVDLFVEPDEEELIDSGGSLKLDLD